MASVNLAKNVEKVEKVEIRCPKYGHYVMSVPKNTPYHAYCHACGLRWDGRA